MSVPDKTGSQYQNSEQVILNDTRDDKYGVIAVELLAENEAGTALLRPQIDASGNLKVTGGGSSGTTNYAAFQFDPDDDAPNYIGKHADPDADDDDLGWVIYKFTYSGANVTVIKKKTGAWSGRVALFA